MEHFYKKLVEGNKEKFEALENGDESVMINIDEFLDPTITDEQFEKMTQEEKDWERDFEIFLRQGRR